MLAEVAANLPALLSLVFAIVPKQLFGRFRCVVQE